MEIIFSKEIDNILARRGIFLSSIGITNWALLNTDALYVLKQFNNMGIPVLGGDVCEMKDNGIIQLNYDNWYYKKDMNKTEIDYVNDSLRYAEEYIRNYNILDKKIYFILIPNT